MTQSLADRYGCSTITFRHMPLTEALDNIAKAGVKKVDIACIPGFCPHIDPLAFDAQTEAELLAKLKEHGQTVSTLNISAGGLNSEKSDFAYKFISAAIPIAQKLGCYAITIPPGSKVKDPALWDENTAKSIVLLKKLKKEAEAHGIQLTIEAPHPGTLTETLADTRRFFEVLNDEGIQITIDTSHTAKGNSIPVKDMIPMMGAAIGHVHFRDCIGDNNHLTPGKGMVDFKGVIDYLEKAGYKADYILELEGEDPNTAAEELEFALQYLAKL